MIDELDRPHWMKTAQEHDAAYSSRAPSPSPRREIATALVIVAVLAWLFSRFV